MQPDTKAVRTALLKSGVIQPSMRDVELPTKFLQSLNEIGWFVVDQAEIARFRQESWSEGYEQGRNDFADENGYPDDDNADDLPLMADDFDVEYELGGEG